MRMIEETVWAAMGPQIDYADLYFEYNIRESLSLEEGIVKTASKNISHGVGVRANAGDKTDMPILKMYHSIR